MAAAGARLGADTTDDRTVELEPMDGGGGDNAEDADDKEKLRRLEAARRRLKADEARLAENKLLHTAQKQRAEYMGDRTTVWTAALISFAAVACLLFFAVITPSAVALVPPAGRNFFTAFSWVGTAPVLAFFPLALAQALVRRRRSPLVPSIFAYALVASLFTLLEFGLGIADAVRLFVDGGGLTGIDIVAAIGRALVLMGVAVIAAAVLVALVFQGKVFQDYLRARGTAANEADCARACPECRGMRCCRLDDDDEDGPDADADTGANGRDEEEEDDAPALGAPSLVLRQRRGQPARFARLVVGA
jgi:hypothetical protein